MPDHAEFVQSIDVAGSSDHSVLATPGTDRDLNGWDGREGGGRSKYLPNDQTGVLVPELLFVA